ncbi:NADH dehydrogenase [ubiquinone] 1 beta subcomplex subunit 6 isoform X2 [Elgaria multicarinata webbii]|uniref:NADH dehydrogenase [ubiquinone] 1 beta subcomplex subunit 6 isoform X2 n=1 Tax=Elgaria multicarinata webbii TaxID=159646 RepID=UPI002FCD2F51
MPEGSGQGSGLVSGGAPRAALGYSPDERLRLQQLRVLRRRWLKDQELSPREPVLPPRKPGLVEGFWERFLQPGGFWRNQAQPYGIVESKRMLFPGDKILETDEVVPPLEVPSSHH